MKKQLKKYLDEPSGFMNGFSLFVSLGAGPELSRLKEISEKAFISTADKECLYAALWKIYHRLPEVEEIPILQQYQQDNPARLEPPIIQELRAEGRKLKKRESFTHALLVQESENGQDQERLFALAKELMEDIEPKLNQVYGQIKAYEKEGILPPGQIQQIQQQAIEQYQKMVNMKNRVYRLKGWLNKKELSEEDRSKYQAEIMNKEEKIQKIKQMLNI